ncbi:MAG TPA: alpha/beta hydrolase [Thermoanaerobaculia bacterium]
MMSNGGFFPEAVETTLSLELRGVDRGIATGGVVPLELQTDAGTITCRYHEVARGEAAVVWIGGAGGGLDGPAGGLYPRLATALATQGIASLRLSYRYPNQLASCVLDTLLGAAYVATQGHVRVALVGHSFGGAVAITAGALGEEVVAVAALSSQAFGTERVPDLSPRPLLLIHGSDDEVLPDICSRDIYHRAREPKEIFLYPDCRHGLDECRERLDRDLTQWLRRALAAL